MTKPDTTAGASGAVAPTPAATPATPTAAAGDSSGSAAMQAQAAKRVEVRNVLTMTFIGVLVVLAAIILWHYIHEYNRPKRDLRTELMAPNTQTNPGGNPMATGAWYLKRAREALDAKDSASCRLLLDDLHEMLAKNKNALDAEQLQQLQAVEEDLQQIKPGGR